MTESKKTASDKGPYIPKADPKVALQILCAQISKMSLMQPGDTLNKYVDKSFELAQTFDQAMHGRGLKK